MDSPIISIIIPVFNGENYIDESIKSIHWQSFREYEIIVVDDGSTDKTADCVKKYPEIKYIYQDNRGPASARNTGVKEARGKYLAFMDADDVWDKNKLLIQFDYMEKHPEVGYTFTKHSLFYTEEMDSMPDWIRKDYGDKEPTAYIPSSLMIRKEIFLRAGYFDESFRLAEDSDWFMRIRDIGIKMVVIEENLLHKRVHRLNLSSNIEETQKNLLRAVKNSIIRNKKKGKISVIVPVYNGEKYLGEAIESIVAQSLKPYEIIVVDDGSTDNTALVCKKYTDCIGTKFKYIKKENEGAALARNIGILEAEGEYLAFLDADDLWTENRLEQGFKEITMDLSCAMVFGMVEEFFSPDTDENFRVRYKCSSIPLKGMHPGTMLIRKDDFMRIGLFSEKYKTGEFLEWYGRASAEGLKHKMIEKVHMKRRIHYSNHGITNKANNEDYAKIIKEILKKKRGNTTDESR
jgi:glycosyltransferase involved in cell wall biosynthesis